MILQVWLALPAIASGGGVFGASDASAGLPGAPVPGVLARA